MPTIVVANATLLREARTAYHALMTGTSPRVVVDQNGERVEFTAANKQSLLTYIAQLESAMATPCGASPTANPAYHPAGFVF